MKSWTTRIASYRALGRFGEKTLQCVTIHQAHWLLSYEMGGGLFVGFDYDATRRRHIWGVFSFSITVRLPCLQLAMLTYKAGPFNSDDHDYV